MTASETIRDIANLLDKVRLGVEVIVEDSSGPIAVIHPAEPKARRLSEILAVLEAQGSTATLDSDFGRDLEEIIASHQEPLTPPKWD